MNTAKPDGAQTSVRNVGSDRDRDAVAQGRADEHPAEGDHTQDMECTLPSPVSSSAVPDESGALRDGEGESPAEKMNDSMRRVQDEQRSDNFACDISSGQGRGLQKEEKGEVATASTSEGQPVSVGDRVRTRDVQAGTVGLEEGEACDAKAAAAGNKSAEEQKIETKDNAPTANQNVAEPPEHSHDSAPEAPEPVPGHLSPDERAQRERTCIDDLAIKKKISADNALTAKQNVAEPPEHSRDSAPEAPIPVPGHLSPDERAQRERTCRDDLAIKKKIEAKKEGVSKPHGWVSSRPGCDKLDNVEDVTANEGFHMTPDVRARAKMEAHSAEISGLKPAAKKISLSKSLTNRGDNLSEENHQSVRLTEDADAVTSSPHPSAISLVDTASNGNVSHGSRTRPGQSSEEARVSSLTAANVLPRLGPRERDQDLGTQTSDETHLNLDIPFTAHTVEVSHNNEGLPEQAVVHRIGIQHHVSETVYEGVPIPPRNDRNDADVSIWRCFSKDHKKKLIASMMLITILAPVVAIAVIFSPRTDEGHGVVGAAENAVGEPSELPASMPSAYHPSERFLSIKAALSLVSSGTAIALENVTTSQYRALKWLADEDARQVDWNDEKKIMQRFAVAAFFFATGGDTTWIDDCNFLSSDNECLWHTEVPEYNWKPGGDNHDVLHFAHKGVFCFEGSWAVDIITIPTNGMTGQLPEEVAFLSTLQHLILYENQLRGTIPANLGNLAELQGLALHVNEIAGVIPQSIGRLSNLKFLSLGYNRLSGPIPSEVNDLSNLEVMFLDSNSLTSSLPPFAAGGLSNLRVLSAKKNYLTGTIPGSISALGDLARIDFWGNALTGALPPEIGNLTNLEVLVVPLNLMDGPIPSSLTNLGRLNGLYLALNDFTGTLPQGMDNLKNLQECHLQFNRLTGSLPDAIGELTQLWILGFDGNLFTGTVPQSLSKLPLLQAVGFSNNSFVGDISFLCRDPPISMLGADCYGSDPEVSCECCSACCVDDPSSVKEDAIQMGDLFGVGKFIDNCFYA